MSIDNPMDLWPASMSHDYRDVVREALSAVLSDTNVDGIVIYTVCSRPGEDGFPNIAPTIKQVTSGNVTKPIAIVGHGPHADILVNRLEKISKVAAFPTISRAVRALAFLRRYCKISRIK